MNRGAPDSPGPAPDRRPVDSSSGKPLPRREQPGYYPRFSTLSQQKFWDAATRQKILDRLREPPRLRFFTPSEQKIMETVAGHILPQDDREPARRIPIVPGIDARLQEGRTAGYRFDEMPPDGDAYRLGFRAIEQIARRAYGGSFTSLSWGDQDQLLKSIHDGKPKKGAAAIWRRMPAHRYWALMVQDCVEMYYAHPWAWDEIGFGGPAYPRAYLRLERGEPEPWEVAESRYEWNAPPDAVSDPPGPDIAAHGDHPPLGQGGTH